MHPHILPLAHWTCTAQIRKSEKNLLERLFTVIHHLTPTQLETLLKEEEGVVKARREARAALEDCKQAIFVVSTLTGGHALGINTPTLCGAPAV